jgi:hypothetical protein
MRLAVSRGLAVTREQHSVWSMLPAMSEAAACEREGRGCVRPGHGSLWL